MDTLTVMKQALEALESRCGTNAEERGPTGAITALSTTIEQMEKKHPAEIDPLPRACHMAGVDYRIYLKIKSYMPVTPAAQRQWVGLTDEEVQWIYDNGRTPAGMIDMAEAKLRQKNGGQA